MGARTASTLGNGLACSALVAACALGGCGDCGGGGAGAAGSASTASAKPVAPPAGPSAVPPPTTTAFPPDSSMVPPPSAAPSAVVTNPASTEEIAAFCKELCARQAKCTQQPEDACRSNCEQGTKHAPASEMQRLKGCLKDTSDCDGLLKCFSQGAVGAGSAPPPDAPPPPSAPPGAPSSPPAKK